jgi:RNA recognition motif-containing protein
MEENRVKRLEERKKANESLPASKTLFVRNISYDTTDEDFKTFFSNFGPLKYALLCKSS